MGIELINLLDVDDTIKKKVREWRNHCSVREYMYTSHLITEEEHEKWINSLKNSEKRIVYVAFINKNPIGILQFYDIDLLHSKCEWGYYLVPDESNKGKGYGALMEYEALMLAFNKMKIEKLNCEVLGSNPVVVKLHKKFGFIEEGIKRKNVYIHNKRENVHLLGILKEEWAEQEEKMKKLLSKKLRGGGQLVTLLRIEFWRYLTKKINLSGVCYA